MKNYKHIIALILLIVSLMLSACGSTSVVETMPNPTQAQTTTIPTSYVKPTKTLIATPSETPYAPKDDFFYNATPESDCFEMIAYNEVHETLLVSFRTNGIYFYYFFPKTEYQKFKDSDSLGSYFNQHIKGKYQYEKGTDDDLDYLKYLLNGDAP